MKLIDLIPYLKDYNRLTELYEIDNLNIDSEAILIYMKEDINIDSETVSFEIEETHDKLLYKKIDINYVQLFPITLAMELIEDLLKNGYDGDSEIAQRLLE